VFELVSHSSSSSGLTLRYAVTNKCSVPVTYVRFGLEGAVDLVSQGQSYVGQLGTYTVNKNAAGAGSPSFENVQFTTTKLNFKDGATEEFEFTVTGATPAWKTNLLLLAGGSFDVFTNVAVGQCIWPDCASPCDTCAGKSGWDWYCLPDGNTYLPVIAASAPAGASLAGSNCDCSGLTPVSSAPSCSQYDCNSCGPGKDTDTFVGVGLCEWCPSAGAAGACTPTGFCEAPGGECASGQIPYSPEPCPGNCSGKGYCNETTGLCVCKNWKDKGLNCGSRNGLNAGAAAAIAGGALAGVIIAAVAVAIILFLAITLGTGAGATALAGKDYAFGAAHTSAITEAPPGAASNGLYTASQ
jgi:hypothetical protein